MRRMLTSIKILAPPPFGPTIPPTDRLLRRSDDVRVLRRSGLHFFLGGGWGLLRHDHLCVWPGLRRGWSPLYDATRPQLLHRAANRAEGLCCTKACGRCEGVEEEGCESRFAVVNPSTAGRCCSANIRSLSTSLGIIFSLLFAFSFRLPGRPRRPQLKLPRGPGPCSDESAHGGSGLPSTLLK
jgi:hypothetical protein